MKPVDDTGRGHSPLTCVMETSLPTLQPSPPASIPLLRMGMELKNSPQNSE